MTPEDRIRRTLDGNPAPPPRVEPLAYADPDRCPAAVGDGYYCVLAIDHDGPHVYSEEPYRAEPEPQADTRAPERWEICPTCQGMGKVMPELQRASDKRACGECHGVGFTQTGSLVEDQAVLQCDKCGGKGWEYAPTPTQEPDNAADTWRARY